MVRNLHNLYCMHVGYEAKRVTSNSMSFLTFAYRVWFFTLWAGIPRYIGLHFSSQPLVRVAAHFRRGTIDFLSSTPSGVSEYSTRGGISGNDSLVIKPSA